MREPVYWATATTPAPRFSENFPFQLPARTDAHFFPSGGVVYQAIKRFVEASSRSTSYTSSRGEDARMKQMQNVVTADWSSEYQKAVAARRLREPDKQSGVAPPSSTHVTVRDVACIRTRHLWWRYADAREALRLLYRDTGVGTNSLHFSVQTQPGIEGMRTLPVLDPTIGETLLFHVTSPDCIEKIVNTGFKASLGRDYGTPGAPRFGMLGQGSYFSNELSKNLTYSTCFLCGDYQCGCRSIETRRKLPRSTLLARVVLGNPKYYATLARKQLHRAAVEQEFRGARFDDARFRAQADGGGGYDSVISHGHNVRAGKTVFTEGTGSGMNEIMSPKDQLIYPEFVVTFVVGDDDIAPSVTEVVRAVLARYGGRSFGVFRNKSTASKKAEKVLAEAVQKRKRDDEIGDLILYYIGVKNRFGGFSPAESWAMLGDQLKRDGTLYRYLVQEMQQHGYLAVA